MKTWTYNVKEKTDDRYKAWGVFFLTSNGILTAVTDYGNYGHRWSQSGFHQPDFRKEVLRMERGYVLEKLFYDRKKDYSAEKTLQGVKEYILSCRRDNSWTKEEAAEEWQLVKDCNNLDSSHDFSLWYDQTKLIDAGEYHRMDYPGDAKQMMDKLFPALKEAIKQELASERFIQEMCA